jgi:hypothetical protein
MNTKKIVLFSILGLVVIIGILFFSFGVRWITAPIEGRVGAREKVESAEHRLYAYEHFYNMYADIKAYDAQIEAQKALLKDLEKGSEHYNKINQNIAGIISQRARVVQEYNADARKVKTRAKFKADDLPYQID